MWIVSTNFLRVFNDGPMQWSTLIASILYDKNFFIELITWLKQSLLSKFNFGKSPKDKKHKYGTYLFFGLSKK